MHAYAQGTLDGETFKLTGFSSDDKLFTCIRGFLWPYGSSKLSNATAVSLFQRFNPKMSALVYIDGLLLMSKSDPYLLQLIKQLHDIANGKNLKLIPEKFFHILFTLKFFGLEIGFITIKPN